MKNIVRRSSCLGFLVVMMFAATVVSQAQIPLDRHVGEIFVAVGSGQYQVWHFDSATGLTLVESITDGVGRGSTAGCAFDSTYHPFTTNVTYNDVFRDKIEDPQTSIQTISVIPAGGGQPTSLAFDSAGNSYVGNAGGNGLIEEYSPGGTLVGTLPVNTNKLKGGSAWMDLSADGKTIYFTNGTNTISQFAVSSNKISKFASISGATFYALRVLTPATQNSTGGLLLVAAVFSGSSSIQLLNSSGVTIKTYAVPGENNFQVLTLDPIQNPDQSWSFWAGNPTTHNFYRINFTTGNIEGSTGISNGPTGLCAYGGFSAAQPQPTPVAATLTPGVNTTNTVCTAADPNNSMDCTFSTVVPPSTSPAACPFNETTNCFGITLHGINLNNAPKGLQLLYNYSQIAQGAGTSDAGLLCDLTSPDGTKCEVHYVHLNPNNGSSDTNIYQGFDTDIFSTQSATNSVVLKNELHPLTDFVIHGSFRVGGSDTTQSIFTLNEQPIQVTGSQSCGYTSPLVNSQYNLGRTIPVKFQAVAAGVSCSAGPFLVNLNARLVLLQFSNLSTPDAAPHPVTYKLSNGTSCPVTGCYYRLDPSSNTWVLNVDTSGLQGGGTVYFGTTIDDSNQIPSFSNTTSGLNVTDFFSLN